jgi:hypothetical protein
VAGSLRSFTYTYDGPSQNHLWLPACRVVPARLCTCAERQPVSDVPSGLLVVVPNASEVAAPLSTIALSTTAWTTRRPRCIGPVLSPRRGSRT